MRRFALIFALACSLLVMAIPSKPDPIRYCCDYAGLLTGVQQDSLENLLWQLRTDFGHEMVVVTTTDLEDMKPAIYAYYIGQTWGVGDKKRDDGIVILLKPRTDTPGALFIAPGRGLEGTLTDITCNRIATDYVKPYLLEEDWFTALKTAALHAMLATLDDDDALGANDNENDALRANANADANADEMSESKIKMLLWGGVLLLLFLIWAIPSFLLWLADQFRRCPHCGHRRGRVVAEKAANSSHAGYYKRRKDCVCAHCGRKFTIYEEMARSRSHRHSSDSSSSSSSSSSYGGGSFSGGGSGTRY